MKFKILQIILLFVLLAGFIFPVIPVFLNASENLEEICQLSNLEKDCVNLSDIDCRKLLEKCEAYFQEKSDEIAKDITKTEAEKKTLQNQIYILNGKIKNLNYQIDQNNIMIKDLSFQVNDTQTSIDKTTLRIEELKDKLAVVLREIYEQDQKSMIEILIAEEELSAFFENLTSLESLNDKNRQFLEDIKNLKISLEGQKKSLDDEKEDLERTVELQILQKLESDKNKKDQEYFLRLTETEYQKYLKEKAEVEKQKSEIRSRIFELIGVAKAPTFGEALEIAKYVERITGIRPAFLLAILTQESAIGKNVGQCYLTNDKTGAGVYVKTSAAVQKVMSPNRDVTPFKSICSKLGRNPHQTLVSCPMSYGWGGAMGPAQFIPSTWVLYEKEIKSALGKDPDPWEIKDAFLASGIYLKRLGGATNEFRAAMQYFSGASWTKAEEFYGNSVIALAKKYQSEIEILERNN